MNQHENYTETQDIAEEITLIDHVNYALDPQTEQRFRVDVLDLLPKIEDQRGTLEDLWGECEDIWLRKNNGQSQYYTGINNAYMPTGFRAIETHVQHVMSQLFPLIFAVVPKQMMTPPEIIRRATALLEHDSLQASIEEQFEVFIRQAFVYGWVVEKTVWKEETKRNYKLINNAGMMELGSSGVHRTYSGPTFEVIDPYDIYIHPFDARDIRSAEIVHQYIRMDVRTIRKNDAGLQNNPRLPFLGTDRLNTENRKQTRRNGEEKKDLRNEKYGLQKNQIDSPFERTACQVWAKFDLYGNGEIVDCKATVIDGVVVELRQNPLKCQEPPYRIWSPFNTGRHIYRLGLAEIMRVLVYILNAIINQMLDANLFQTNMMMAIDTNRYQGRPSDIEIAPFTVFPMGGIGPVKDAVQFFKPEMNLQQTLLAANLVATTIQDSVAAQASIQGKYSSKERTKGEVDTVTAAAMTGVSAMVRSLSINVLAKWFEDSLELERQYRDPLEILKISGMPDFAFPFEDREHDYWVRILTTPEAEQFKMAQAAMQQTMTGGQGSDNSNPSGVNSPGGMNGSPIGGADQSFGSGDGGVG